MKFTSSLQGLTVAVYVVTQLVIQHPQIPNISCFLTLKPPSGEGVCLEQRVQTHWNQRQRKMLNLVRLVVFITLDTLTHQNNQR